MNVILDTNIFFKDWKFSNEDSINFLAFVRKTKSKIYIPQIVWDEIKVNYREDIIKKQKEYERASKLFGSSLVSVPELRIIRLDYEAEVRNYLSFLCDKLEINEEENILPYNDLTERLTRRAIAKRRPFNGKNEREFKDSVLWECVLDVVAGKSVHPAREVAFISRDGNAFKPDSIAQPSTPLDATDRNKSKLHAQLIEDVDEVLATSQVESFYYFESFPEFLSAHYTPIKGIDTKSVMDFLSSGATTFGSDLYNILLADKELLLYHIRQANPTLTISSDFVKIEILEISDVEEFYVFHKAEGKVSASGSVYVKISAPVAYAYFVGSNYHSLKPLLHVTFNVYYANGKPIDLRIETVVVIPGEWLELPRPKFPSHNLFHNTDFSRQVADALFELEDDPPWALNDPAANIESRRSASNSKFLPKKVGTESRNRGKSKK